jgi:hypothetical protein
LDSTLHSGFIIFIFEVNFLIFLVVAYYLAFHHHQLLKPAKSQNGW